MVSATGDGPDQKRQKNCHRQSSYVRNQYCYCMRTEVPYHLSIMLHGKDVSRVFPKVDYSGNDARIVLEQNKFSKNSYL